MNKIARLFLLFAVLAGAGESSAQAQDWLDRLDDSLAASAFNGAFRVRLSGLLDLEAYHIEQPSPGLIYTDRSYLFNPRLTLFLDAQAGPFVYGFVQTRLDRGFDPSDAGLQVRADEYAVRVTPWSDGRFNIQVGKFATVVGNWAQRHDSWDNPFITAPLPYENLTGVWDTEAPESASELLSWAHANSSDSSREVYSDKNQRNPIIWGPSYASGFSIFGAVGKFDYAAELKNSALSSRPEAWDVSEVGFAHPTYSGRLGWRPDEKWRLGVSESIGPYLLAVAAPTLPAGNGIGDYREALLGQDISFAWHHFQLWAEFYEVRWDIPNVGAAATFAYYVEAKYKFTPQLFGALRWNQQLYGDIRDDNGQEVQWGRDAWRVDAAIGYRITERAQIKLQYSLLREIPAENAFNNLLAVQFTLRF